MVARVAEKQQSLEARLAKAENTKTQAFSQRGGRRPPGPFYSCGKGMIEPSSGIDNDARQGISLARIVVKPDQHRVVPLRVINMSHSQIELAAGENIAEFCPLVESCSNVINTKPDVCGAVGRELFKTFTDNKISCTNFRMFSTRV